MEDSFYIYLDELQHGTFESNLNRFIDYCKDYNGEGLSDKLDKNRYKINSDRDFWLSRPEVQAIKDIFGQ